MTLVLTLLGTVFLTHLHSDHITDLHRAEIGDEPLDQEAVAP